MKKKLAMIFATCMTLSLTMGCTVFGAENSTEEAKQGYDRRIEAREEKSEKQEILKIQKLAKEILEEI